jgi:hypothetical protein
VPDALPFPAPAPGLADVIAAIERLREAVLARPEALPPPPPAPRHILFGWAEILPAVGRDDDGPTRRLVARMNRLLDGPIVRGGQGARPWAYRDELVPWWHSLRERHEAREQERLQKQLDTATTLQDRYPYARTGTVAPGIAGSIRKSRRKAA